MTTSDQFVLAIHRHMLDRTAQLRGRLAGLGCTDIELAPYFEAAVRLILSDLRAHVKGDPAALGSHDYVLASYSSFWASADYRIAHEILSFGKTSGFPGIFREEARKLTESAKAMSGGIDIHPGAVFGAGLRLDHGVGTVIGEGVEGGSDCIIMQKVILGARGASVLKGGRRHPRLGDRVTVCGFARVLGPVCIGDDCFIGPGVVVTDSLPPGTRVTMASSQAVARYADGATRNAGPTLFGVRPVPVRCCRVFGRHLDGWRPRIVLKDATDEHGEFVDLVNFDYRHRAEEFFISNATLSASASAEAHPCLLLEHGDGSTCRIYEQDGLASFYQELRK